MVKEVETKAELNEILQKEDAVVVDFSATWCGPCRAIAPFYEELSKKHPKITFLKVDVDVFDGSEDYNVSAMPTFVFFKKNEEVSRMVGANKEKLVEIVEGLAS